MSDVGEGTVVDDDVAIAGVDWVTETPCPATAPADDTEEVLEVVRGLRSTSLLLEHELIAGARSARLEGYFWNASAGKGGSPLSLSRFCCDGASSGVTGIGRLMVEAVDGVSTASLPDLNDNPLWRVLESEGLLRTPSLAFRSSSGMLSVNEKVDPTLLVLVRPLTLMPPLADRFCHEVGGSGGRGLGPAFREDEASLSILSSSCSVLLLKDLDNGCIDDLNEDDDDDRFVRFRVESRRVNGDGASSSSLWLGVSMHVLLHTASSNHLPVTPSEARCQAHTGSELTPISMTNTSLRCIPLILEQS